MITLDLESNIEAAKLAVRDLSEDLSDRAVLRALNRAGDQSMTAIGREIRKVYNVPAAVARSQVRVLRRAIPGNLQFEIRVSGRRIPLIEFSPRPGAPSIHRRSPGVSVSIKKGQRKSIAHAFVQRMKSGHVGVMVRSRGRAKTDVVFRYGAGSRLRRGGSDLPITELTGPSLPRMFVQQLILEAVQTVALNSFNRTFEGQVRLFSRR
jgi:hypothetical protein